MSNGNQSNTYQWRGDLGGSTEEQYMRNTYNNMGRFANQLSDFQSPFYQQFRSYMGSMTPTMGTNAMLAPLMAGGGNMGASQVQANMLHKNYLGQRNDFLNKGVQQFAQGNMGMIGSLLGQQGSLASNAYSTKTQREISDQQQGGALDFFGNLLGAGAGMFMGGFNPFGGSGMAQGAR